MTAYYADTSAVVKLLLAEPESSAVKRWADGGDVELVGTPLLETELRRVAHRARLPQAAATAVLDRIAIHDLPRQVFVEAGLLLPGQAVRSLDALHLAAALQLGVGDIVTYDARLADAAEQVGLAVLAPS